MRMSSRSLDDSAEDLRGLKGMRAGSYERLPGTPSDSKALAPGHSQTNLHSGPMHASEHTRLSRMSGPLGLGLLTLLGVVLLTSTGLGANEQPWFGPVSALAGVLSAAPFALLYVLSAWGLGRPLARLLAPTSASRLWLQLALGIALALFVSHALGVLGLLSSGMADEHSARARSVAWGVVLVGLALLGDQVLRGSLRPERWGVLPKLAMVWAPALALLIAAASNPPGWLWESEHGAYDALSYHLQLPKEWAAGDRLWPTQHNVYSFLPSYIEAAYLHLGQLMPGPSQPTLRMLGGEGAWVLSCQFLHALLALIASALVARAAWVACRRSGASEAQAANFGVCAGGLALAVPWVSVVGSLAYNEAGVLAMMGGALIAAMDERLGPCRRGLICGVLVGAATSAKPTAAFLVAPVVGILMLLTTPARAWVWATLSATLSGSLLVAPWLVRNALASGNPVFPFAAERLGSGHWSFDQVVRYASNHMFQGTFGERAARLFSREFGLLHEQWAILGGVLVVSAAIALTTRTTRALALALVAGLVLQALAWMMFTHLQSRFLIPIIPVACVLFALACAAAWQVLGRVELSTARASSLLRTTLLAMVPVATAVWGLALFASDRSRTPNALLVSGVSGMTGLGLIDRSSATSERAIDELIDTHASPIAYINLRIRPHERPGVGVFLLGDSAPLYILGARGATPAAFDQGGTLRAARSPVLYHTTWDASPLGNAMRATPDADPAAYAAHAAHAAWTGALQALGVRYLLINFDELIRLSERDHYYDPVVTLKSVMRWLNDPASRAFLEKRWPRPGVDPATPSGSSLYRFNDPTTGTTDERTTDERTIGQ